MDPYGLCSSPDNSTILDAFLQGLGKGALGELVAITGGLFDKKSSIFAENYLGWIDTSDPYVNQGIWAERISIGATLAALGTAGYTGATRYFNTGTELGMQVEGTTSILLNEANIAKAAADVGIPASTMTCIAYHHESYHRAMGILARTFNSEKAADIYGWIVGTINSIFTGLR